MDDDLSPNLLTGPAARAEGAAIIDLIGVQILEAIAARRYSVSRLLPAGCSLIFAANAAGGNRAVVVIVVKDDAAETYSVIAMQDVHEYSMRGMHRHVRPRELAVAVASVVCPPEGPQCVR